MRRNPDAIVKMMDGRTLAPGFAKSATDNVAVLGGRRIGTGAMFRRG